LSRGPRRRPLMTREGKSFSQRDDKYRALEPLLSTDPFACSVGHCFTGFARSAVGSGLLPMNRYCGHEPFSFSRVGRPFFAR
jgi:hypothetical protein